MKLILTVLMLIAFASLTFAQDKAIEANFEKNKAKLKLDKQAMGEDASSGYDYLVYKDKKGIVKLRVIWSSSAGPAPRIEDYYFDENGKLVLYVKAGLQKKLYKTAITGRNVVMTVEEKVYLKDSKLTAWNDKGKVIKADDPRLEEKELQVLKEKEKEILEKAKGELEMYQMILDDFK